MKKNMLWIIVLGIICFLLIGVVSYLLFFRVKVISINIGKLEYSNNQKLKVYKVSQFDEFLKDYQNKELDEVYVTNFLFDGVDMYKAHDLDDFIEKGNEVEVKPLETVVINVNGLGNYEFQGELKGGMIAVNTNTLKGDVNLILNNVKLDTDSKKIPVIYVYNKDITNTDCHVSINTKKNTKNVLEGGKLKKISLLAQEELNNYKEKYSGDVLNNYTNYTNYYGIYTKDELNNILFASTTADMEDLADGDPYYYYKASGAISSDIDLYFKGKGELQVISKNKEGIESKGNLIFSGGKGDYVVNALDDCLNTTTDFQENRNAHNKIEINVHSLAAIVSLDADEGDAIDSNGTLTINGGTIIALAQYGADSGIDSEKGTIINKGEVISTLSMMDPISNESKQRFVVLNTNQEKDSLITMLDENNKVVFSFKSDRKYSALVYSSSKLKNNKTYYFYQDGKIDGKDYNGFYSSGKYTLGTQLGYTTKSNNNGMRGPGGGQPPQGEPPKGEPGEPPQGQPPQGESGQAPQGQPGQAPQGQPGEPPQGQPPQGQPGEPPQGQPGQAPQGQPPEIPNGERPQMPNGEVPQMPQNDMFGNTNPINKEFVIDGISNIFTGVGILIKE